LNVKYTLPTNWPKSLTIRQFLLGNLYRPKDEKVQKFKVPLKILGAALDNLVDFPFKAPEEVRFVKPALFVRGTQSHYIPDEALPIIGRFFPRFELVDIDAGHWVISEKPELFRRGMHDISTLRITADLVSYSCCRFPQTQRIEMYHLVYIGIKTMHMPVTLLMPIRLSKTPMRPNVALDMHIL
jgi:hypothetical protein